MNAALLRYDIHNLTKTMETLPASLWPKNAEATLARKKAELPIAARRELKRLAKVLTYKWDIYGPNGRIYAADAKFTVSPDGKLFHGTTELDPLV